MASRPTTRVKVQSRSRVKVSTIPKFPAQVIAGDGINIESSGGVFTFSVDPDFVGGDVWTEFGNDIFNSNDGSVGIGTGAAPNTSGKLHVAAGILTTSFFAAFPPAASGGIDYLTAGMRLLSVGTGGSTKGTFKLVGVGVDASLAERLAIDSAGVLTFGAYGAGALVTNASGIVSSASGTSGYALISGGAGVAPAFAGFLQGGSGAITRTWQDKGRDTLNAKDFGVTADGVTDDAAALNAAFVAGGATGKTVLLPPGVILFNSALTATGSPYSFDIVGAGSGSTKLRSTFATGDVLTYNVTNGTIRSIRFESTVVRTSGATIRLIPNGALVFDVTIGAPYIGIYNTGIVNRIIGCSIGTAVDVDLGTGPITSRATAAESGGVYNDSGLLQIASTTISSGITTPTSDFAEYCIRNRGEVDVTNSYLFATNKGYWSDPIFGGIGSITGCWIDSILDAGIKIDSSSGANENEHMITGNWITCGYGATSATAGILLRGENTRYITISNNLIVGYNGGVGQGIWLDQTPSVGVNAVGVTISGNVIGLAPSLGFANGIFTSTNINSFNIAGNNFKGNTGAITLSAGADDYAIDGNNLEGNTFKLTGTSSSTTKKVGLNTGVDIVTAAGPVGSATSIPVITYDSEGRITAVSTATPTVSPANITGLGTGVATALGQNVTGSGGIALATSPTFTGTVNAGAIISSDTITAGNTFYHRWASSTLMSAPADGRLLLQNNAATDFGRLQLGGTTSSFPAIKRNAAALNFRLADDSADANITAADVTGSGTIQAGPSSYVRWASSTLISAPADGQLLLQNGAATAFTRLQLGGTTSSFPSIKRNSTALNFRLADDSADAPITAGATTLTSINKVTITAPAISATLTIADGKTLTASNTLTFAGTDGSSVTFGAGGTVLYASSVAAQSDQETATSTTTFVSPGRQQFHPSAAKGWINFSPAGSNQASYNVTSLTDGGAGNFTVNWNTDFSSADYAIVVGIDISALVETHPLSGSVASGSNQVLSVDNTGSLSETNISGYHCVAFGDQ